MFDMLKNLTKATVAVSVVPLTAAVDFLMWPLDIENGTAPRTKKKLDQAGRALDKVIEPENKDHN